MKLGTPTRAGGGAALVAFLSISLICSATAGAAPPPSADVVAGEAIVRFAPVGTQARARALAAADADWGASVRGVPGTRRVELDEGESVTDAVRALNRQPGVRWAEPNYVYRLAQTPDDPLFPELWGMRNTGQEVQGVSGVAGVDIGAERAWDVATGSDDVRVAIVDSGIDATHPDLQDNLNSALSRNFMPDAEGEVDAGDWADTNEHGTHVAGTVGAVGDNGLGVAGVEWEAELVAARVCDLDGSCPTASIAEGLAYAGSIGAEVANASIGGPDHSFATEAAVAANPDTLYVIAAGNETRDVDAEPSYPCAMPQDNIVCVAAIDSSAGLADFSNWGSENVDLGAPGVDILSTVPELVTRFDGSGGLADWSQEPAGRWDYNEEFDVIEFDDETPLPEESTLTTSAPFDLSGGEDCRLTYGLGLDTTEDEQILFVEASTDGVEWTPVQGEAEGYSGTTGEGLVPITEKLEAFDGEGAVQLRYRFAVTPAAQGEGAIVAISAPKVACIHPQPADGAYNYLSGTSMASPHVAGVAALARSAFSEASAEQVRAAILETVVPTASLQGTTETGGRVDAPAVLEALKPEPPPPPSPEPRPRPGWALGRPAGHRVVVSPGGRARLRVRCRADVVQRCQGRLVLLARVRRGRRGLSRQRVVLAARGFTLAKGRRAARPAWLRPRAARLLRNRRIGRVQLLIRTRQPQAAERRMRRHVSRVGLRLRPARRAAGRR